MAYSKTPTYATYQTKQIPFVYKWDNRSGVSTPSLEKDAYSTNVIFEPVKNETTGQQWALAYKRDGCRAVSHQPYGAGYVNPYEYGTHVYSVYYSFPANALFITSLGGTVVGEASSGANDIQLEYFTALSAQKGAQWDDYSYEDGTVSTLVGYGGGSGSYIEFVGTNYNGAGFTASNFSPPTPPAFHTLNGDPTVLDGYVFVSSTDGSIWNSNLNDPHTWSPSNFISAENYSDRLFRIKRSGSYIVAFGSNSIEWFYDAANPTGSPLSVYPGATQKVGYVGGLATKGDTLYFVGTSNTGEYSLYSITGLKLQRISDFTFSRAVQHQGNTTFARTEIGYGTITIMNGHSIYNFSQLYEQTISYDLDSGLFTYLQFKGGLDMEIHSATVIPLISDHSSGLTDVLRYYSLFARSTENKIYVIQPQLYQDDGVNYTVTLQTSNYDFGTHRLKFGSRVALVCDQTSADSWCQVSYSTDDFQTFKTHSPINLSETYTPAFRLGAFRKVAFKVTYTDNFPMRFNNIEMDFDLGGS